MTSETDDLADEAFNPGDHMADVLARYDDSPNERLA